MSIYTSDTTLPYCTYLTIYKGNKLPPFYIGYSTTEKVLEKSYHGSPSSKDYGEVFRDEVRTNPHLFKTIILNTHATRAEALKREIVFQQHNRAHSNPLFINRAIGSATGVTVHVTEERRKKMSQNFRGSRNPMYNRTWCNDGTKNIPIAKDDKVPFGCVLGFLQTHDFSGENNPNYGKHFSPEKKARWSAMFSGENNPMYGRGSERTKEFRENQTKRMKANNPNKNGLSDEHKTKIKAANSKPKERTVCPHCSLEGSVNGLKRYHFDNCKQIISGNICKTLSDW